MSIGNLSIFWHFRFLSWETWSYCHTGLSLVWLELPKIFYISCGYCEGNGFPNFFLSLFILCIKEGYLFELILYPATLLKLFISCKVSLVKFLVTLNYTIISPANSDILTSSFPICIPLTSFCCLIALARNWSTILNR